MNRIILIILVCMMHSAAWGQNCAANFTYTLFPGTYTIQFTDASSGNGSIVTQFWNFGDGNVDSIANPLHTYSVPGTYIVCHTILTINPQCVDTKCDTVVVPNINPICVSAFSWNYMGGNYCQFTNTSSSNTHKWIWNFGDNSTSTVQHANHTYQSAGIYTVCLTAMDTINNCTDTFCTTLTIQNANCQADFTYSIDTAYNGTVTFNGNTLGQNIMNWFWDFGNGDTSSLQTVTYTFANMDTQTVCLTITDNTGCMATKCIPIVLTSPNCKSSFNYTVIDGTVTLNDGSWPGNGGNIISYNWDFGDYSGSFNANAIHTYDSAGTYMVNLSIVTNLGCSHSHTEFITVGTPPLCESYFNITSLGFNNIIFNNYSQTAPGATYLWQFGDGDTSTLHSPQHLYPNPGPWYACLTVNANGCITTYCDSLKLNSLNCESHYQFALDTNNKLTVHFNDVSAGQLTNWDWDFGDNTTSTLQNPVHTFAQSGIYTVCLTITSVNGCSSTQCQTISVIESGCYDGFSYFQNMSTGEVFFMLDTTACANVDKAVWKYNDGYFGTGINPVHIFADSGWYDVCVTKSTNSVFTTTCENIYINLWNSTNVFESTYVLDIKTFPNPSLDGHIWLHNNSWNGQPIEVEILNSMGQLSGAKQQITGNKDYKVDLSNLENGLYIIKITADRKLYRSKVYLMKTP